jgi:predicted nucleic acid-binding protein
MPSASVVSVAELYAGLRSQRDERHIELMVSKLHVLPVTAEIGRQAGQFMRHYGAGHAVELGDALVAATAEQHGLALATLNVKHFPMFPRLKAPY